MDAILDVLCEHGPLPVHLVYAIVGWIGKPYSHELCVLFRVERLCAQWHAHNHDSHGTSTRKYFSPVRILQRMRQEKAILKWI